MIDRRSTHNYGGDIQSETIFFVQTRCNSMEFVVSCGSQWHNVGTC